MAAVGIPCAERPRFISRTLQSFRRGDFSFAGARGDFAMSKPEVLIVDDDKSFLAYVAQFLTQRGYVVHTLESADQLPGKLAMTR
jgi:PleD family two-component response regulator